jgi:hypothetical protein
MTPWWGSLLFVFAGAMLSAMTAYLLERLRHHREDQVRWHSEKRAVYEKFLNSAEKMYDAELLIAEHTGNIRDRMEWYDDYSLYDEEDVLRQAENVIDGPGRRCIDIVRRQRPTTITAQEQMNEAIAAMEVISHPELVDAARSYRDAMQELIPIAFEFPPRSCGGWSEPLVKASQQVHTTREAFVAGIRKELGVDL